MLVLLACSCASSRATSVRLSYKVAPQARNCLDAAALQRAVRDLLGYSPWRELAPRVVEARVVAEADRLLARIRLRQHGKDLGTRTLEASISECSELGAAMALAVSLAVDPLAAPRRGRRSARRPRLELGLGGHLALGMAPRATGGGQLELALRWKHLSLGVGARVDAPGYGEIQGGQVSAQLMGGALFGCAHLRGVFACPVLLVGALRGAGHGLVDARSTLLPIVSSGLRAGAELALTPRISIRLLGELLFSALGAQLTDNTETRELWTTPLLSSTLGVGLVTFFL